MSDSERFYLTIAIPTFNRASKLIRLLKNIDENIANNDPKESICVFISDNASTDGTDDAISSFKAKHFELRYERQPENNGSCELNMLYLYTHATSPYVWFMSDDDFLMPEAINKVCHGLRNYNPDLLLFSFLQPVTSKERTFQYPNPYEVITDPVKIIDDVRKKPKITIYVMSRIDLSKSELNKLEQDSLERGMTFLDLSYTIFDKSQNPRLCVISQPLAASDDDYQHMAIPFRIFKGYWKPMLHPFVMRYQPNLWRKEWRRSVAAGIDWNFLIQGKWLYIDEKRANENGGLGSESEYREAAKLSSLSFRELLALFSQPVTIAKLICIKLGIVYWLRKTRLRLLGRPL